MRNLFILFVASLCFVACKKEDNKTDPTLTDYKEAHKLYLLVSNPSELVYVITGKASTLPEGYSVTLSYMKTGDNAWKEWKTVAVNSDTIHLTEGLEHQGLYDVKLEISKGSDKILVDQSRAGTGTFTVDYDLMYNRDNKNYLMSLNQVFSLEGAVHKIAGKFFTNATIKGQVLSREDTSQKMDVAINILNDTTISFKMPEVLPKDSYLYRKAYYLKLNNKYFRWNDADTVVYNVSNDSVYTASMKYYPDSTGQGCHTIIFDGHFGMANFNTYADSVYGIPVRVKQIHLSISNSAGMIAGSYDVPMTSNSDACETVSQAFPWAGWSDVGELRLKSGLPAGNYTLIVYTVLVDGSRRLSNQFKFIVP